MTSWWQTEGSPQPLGATWLEEEQSYNFALYSRHATAVTLLIYSAGDLLNPAVRFRLNYLLHKSGRIWHCRLAPEQIGDARYYAYSVDGPNDPRGPCLSFDPDKLLLDPYARSIFFPPGFNRRASIGRGSNAGRVPLGVLDEKVCSFDWSDESRPHHTSDTNIYEMHVKGFTLRANSGVNAEERGTYAGVIAKILYLRELGITAAELRGR
jgi:isoamylase